MEGSAQYFALFFVLEKMKAVQFQLKYKLQF